MGLGPFFARAYRGANQNGPSTVTVQTIHFLYLTHETIHFLYCSFERYNKKIKNLVGNKNYPIAMQNGWSTPTLLVTVPILDLASPVKEECGCRLSSCRLDKFFHYVHVVVTYSFGDHAHNTVLPRSMASRSVHDTTPLTIYSHIQPITHDSLATTLTHTPLNRHPHTPHTTPSSLQGSL